MKENMYNTVKKHDAEIDGLRKMADDHEKRIGTIETRGMATAPESPDTAITPTITLSISDNIATIDNVKEATQAALIKQEDAILKFATKVIDKWCEEVSQVIPKSAPTISTKMIDEAASKAAKEAVEKIDVQRYEKADKLYDHTMERIHCLVDGAVWAAIPKWFYVVFGVSLVATIGFCILFFLQLNENSRLRDVEWEYRHARTYFRSEAEHQLLINNEKSFFKGTSHERDSIKNMIRQREVAYGLDKLNLYFYPTEK